MTEEFCGFPREFSDFLFELAFDNTFAKQQENIVPYKKYITEPLKLLYESLLPVIDELDAGLETKRARCVSTPYTDRRFSPEAPLKEYMYLKFRTAGKTEDVPGLYFDMGCDRYSYGVRVYRKTPLGMRELREKIAADPKPYRDELEKLLADGFEICGEKYKRDHCADEKDPLVKEMLNRKYFSVEKDKPINERVFTPEFAEELAEAFKSLGGMVKLLIDK